VLLRMNQRLRAARENEGGFTLIELLIVIVILGVLTGIVVIGVGAFTDRGQTAACKSDKKIVEVALEAYRAKVGHYPDETTSILRFKQLTDDGYLKEAPTGTGYTISISDTNGTIATTGGLC
jgi:prepilin-type N-terminal cleavage/methylation domain-containing protein